MSRFRAVAVLVAVFVASVAVGVGRPAEAARTSLAAGFGGIAVDDTHHHVFVSSPDANLVTVLDYAGQIVTTITGLGGAGSMLVDGSTLYVVLGNDGSVKAFDTASYQLVGTYGSGTLVKPGPLAMAGGKLWTSTGQCTQWDTKLASIDLAAQHTVTVYDVPTMLQYCIGLADGPHDSNQLVAWDAGLSPSTTFLIDVSSGAPMSKVEVRHSGLSYMAQAAITPDGQRFLVAAPAPYEIGEYQVSDQAPTGRSYATGYYPNAVTVTAARGGLVAAGRSGDYSPDIDVYVLGDPGSRVWQYDFGPTDNLLYSRGLAFSGDGRLLFAVSGDVFNSRSARFSVFDLTQPPPTTTTTSSSTTTTTATTTTTTTTTQQPPPESVDPLSGPGTLADPPGDVRDPDRAPVTEPRADIIAAGVAVEGGQLFGDVRFFGSLGANPPPQPIVAVALAR